MSFPQNGESTFPDSRNPVRMDTEDQSFAGKPKHDFGSTTHGTHGTHHSTTNPSSTAATAGSNTNTNTSTYTETMPLTGAPLVHHVHRDDEPLPGAKGGAKTFDYSPENIDQARNLPTGSGESQPFRSGEHTSGNLTSGTGTTGAGAMGGHANTARAYGGSTTEGSGDFRGPTLASTGGNHDLSSGVNPTHNTHGTHGTHNSSRVSQPVGDLKPHTGNNNNHGRTDNYNTVSATGNHDSTHPSHHTGTGTANKTPYDGAGNEPTNKASIGDKIIGKTEQIAGKIANKPALQEKGEMRQAGIN